MKTLKTKLQTILTILTLFSLVEKSYCITIQPATVPVAYCQYYYSQSFSIAGSSNIFTYSCTPLPLNLSMGVNTGVLSGSINSRVGSIATFTVTARSTTTPTLTATRSYTLTIQNKVLSKQQLLNVWKQPYPQYADVYSTFFNSLDTIGAASLPFPPYYADSISSVGEFLINTNNNALLLKSQSQIKLSLTPTYFIDMNPYYLGFDNGNARFRFSNTTFSVVDDDIVFTTFDGLNKTQLKTDYFLGTFKKGNGDTLTSFLFDSTKIVLKSDSLFVDIPTWGVGKVLTGVAGAVGGSEWLPLSLSTTTVTTQSPGTNNGTIANTAFVTAAVAAITTNTNTPVAVKLFTMSGAAATISDAACESTSLIQVSVYDALSNTLVMVPYITATNNGSFQVGTLGFTGTYILIYTIYNP